MKSYVLAVLVIARLAHSQTLKSPEFTGPDTARDKIAVQLVTWADSFSEVTDIQFIPGDTRAVVLEKTGAMYLVSRATPAQRQKVLQLAVLTTSEQGLLGIALHPRFATNKKFYLNYNPGQGTRRTRVSEWVLQNGKADQERVLLEVEQPYPNHKAGQLVFGPDGMLYVGFGDGGFAGDPQDNGQRTGVLLGKMLRIDVDRKTEKKAYGIPADNPFVKRAGYAPEIFALGLRNPWRYTFDAKGRLIVADVGQNLWEEISVVESGGNYGWRVREADHCYLPARGCKERGYIDPWLEYGREDGGSITGGFVYTGKAISALRNKYVFGDFVSGRIWAADLPSPSQESKTTRLFQALGRWPIQISTFGRDPEGEIYVADFLKGSIYRLATP